MPAITVAILCSEDIFPLYIDLKAVIHGREKQSKITMQMGAIRLEVQHGFNGFLVLRL